MWIRPGAALLLLATACSSGEDVPSPATGGWQCEPALRTPAPVDTSGPRRDLSLAEAVRRHVEPPYAVDRQRDVALVQAFADDSLTGEYRFVRGEAGWSLASAEECG